MGSPSPFDRCHVPFRIDRDPVGRSSEPHTTAFAGTLTQSQRLVPWPASGKHTPITSASAGAHPLLAAVQNKSMSKPARTSVAKASASKRKQPEAAASRGGTAGSSGSGADEFSNILYIGHLPHGFYEKELRGFFSQFGDVKNVRLSRSKKTAKSKGFAFLEFKHVEVAPIAAQAMDGYMMFSQKLKVHVVKRADVHAELFKGSNRVFKAKNWRGMASAKHNQDRSNSESDARLARAVKRDKARQKAISASGIDYTYDSLADAVPKKAKRTVFADT